MKNRFYILSLVSSVAVLMHSAEANVGSRVRWDAPLSKQESQHLTQSMMLSHAVEDAQHRATMALKGNFAIRVISQSDTWVDMQSGREVGILQALALEESARWRQYNGVIAHVERNMPTVEQLLETTRTDASELIKNGKYVEQVDGGWQKLDKSNSGIIKSLEDALTIERDSLYEAHEQIKQDLRKMRREIKSGAVDPDSNSLQELRIVKESLYDSWLTIAQAEAKLETAQRQLKQLLLQKDGAEGLHQSWVQLASTSQDLHIAMEMQQERVRNLQRYDQSISPIERAYHIGDKTVYRDIHIPTDSNIMDIMRRWIPTMEDRLDVQMNKMIEIIHGSAHDQKIQLSMVDAIYASEREDIQTLIAKVSNVEKSATGLSVTTEGIIRALLEMENQRSSATHNEPMLQDGNSDLSVMQDAGEGKVDRQIERMMETVIASGHRQPVKDEMIAVLKNPTTTNIDELLEIISDIEMLQAGMSITTGDITVALAKMENDELRLAENAEQPALRRLIRDDVREQIGGQIESMVAAIDGSDHYPETKNEMMSVLKQATTTHLGTLIAKVGEIEKSLAGTSDTTALLEQMVETQTAELDEQVVTITNGVSSNSHLDHTYNTTGSMSTEEINDPVDPTPLENPTSLDGGINDLTIESINDLAAN